MNSGLAEQIILVEQRHYDAFGLWIAFLEVIPDCGTDTLPVHLLAQEKDGDKNIFDGIPVHPIVEIPESDSREPKIVGSIFFVDVLAIDKGR